MKRPGILVVVLLLAAAFLAGLAVGRAPHRAVDPDRERDAAEMEQAVRTVMSERLAFSRSSALAQLFQGLDAENVAGAVRAMRTRSDYLDPVDLQVFLSAWTRFDAAAAMRAAELWPSQVGREIAMRLVMREWAASGRTLEAANYYESLRSAATRSIVAGPLIRGWALSDDVDAALERVRVLWEQGEPLDAVDGFVRGALQAEGTGPLLERVLAMEPDRGGAFEHRLTRVALNLGAREDPRAAARVYAQLEGAKRPDWLYGALAKIAHPWAEAAPGDAIAWLLDRAETRERTVVLKEVMRGWATRDFEAAWDWWSARDAQVQSGAREAGVLRAVLLPPLLRSLARIRPQEAAVWVAEIEKPAARQALVLRIAYFWSGLDRSAAERWVAALSLSESQAMSVAEAIARGARRGPDDADDADLAEEEDPDLPPDEPLPLEENRL